MFSQKNTDLRQWLYSYNDSQYKITLCLWTVLVSNPLKFCQKFSGFQMMKQIEKSAFSLRCG